MIVPQLDISWPPKMVEEAIEGYQKWSEVTSYVSAICRLEGYDITDSVIERLPPHVQFIPSIKPAVNKRLDDPNVWTDIRNRIMRDTQQCSTCKRLRSNIAMLDIEICTRNWVVEGNPSAMLNLRSIYDEVNQLLDIVDELWIHPSVYDHPADRDGVRQRSEQLCRAIELGLPATAVPRVHWISQRVQGEEALTDRHKEACWKVLKSFTRSDPVAKLYFYTDPPTVERWWDYHEVHRAIDEAAQLGMHDVLIYPGVTNWRAATIALVAQLKSQHLARQSPQL